MIITRSGDNIYNKYNFLRAYIRIKSNLMEVCSIFELIDVVDQKMNNI